MPTINEVDFVTATNGEGLWSIAGTNIRIVGISVQPYDWDFGEVRVYFNTDDWNVEYNGLIYTDPLWIQLFRLALENEFGLSADAAADVDYSEQGMQGDDYVSLDCGDKFMFEWFTANDGDNA